MKKELAHIAGVGAIALSSLMLFSSCILEKRHTSDGELREGLITVSNPIQPFTEIEASGALIINYTQAPTDSVRIEGEASRIADVLVEQDGPVLKLSSKKGWIKQSDSSSKIVVYLSSDSLTYISLSGANKLNMDSPVSVANLSMTIAGAGDVDVAQLKVRDKFELSLSGAGNADLDEVVAADVRIEMTGAGDVDAKIKGAANVDIQVSGAGDADLDLTDCGRVFCGATGAADINLSGNANSLSFRSSGAADVDYGRLKVADDVQVR